MNSELHGRLLRAAGVAVLCCAACSEGSGSVSVGVRDGGGGFVPEDAGTEEDAARPDEDQLPTVRITLPADGATVQPGMLRVEGEASDDRAVDAVFVRVGPNVPLRADTDDNFKHFSIELPLPEGSFEVWAQATDSAGQRSEPSTVQVEAPADGADSSPPTVAILSPADGSTPAQSLALVTGTTEDDRGVVGIDVQLNGTAIAERPVETDNFFLTWARLVPLVPGQDNVLVFTARDAAGNEGSATITLGGPVEADRDPPLLVVDEPADASTVDTDALDVTGAASDDVGVREVKVRVGQQGQGGDIEWGDYVLCTTEDGFATWRCEGVAVPVGPVAVEVKAIDLNGLASTQTVGVDNVFVPEWTPEVALPLRIREVTDKPVLTLRLDRDGVNEVISAEIQADTRLLELDTTTLLTSALNQIKNSCGTAWQNDSSNPQHDCSAAYGPNWQSSPEYSFVRLLTMTPANVDVTGTSIDGLQGLADFLNVGGGFRQILAETLGISRTQEIVGTPGLVRALQDFFMADHPEVLPGAKLPVTLFDAMNDLNPLATTFGPQGAHPGIVDPSFPVQSEVFTDQFEMLLEAESNLLWKEGVDVSNASATTVKDYIALVADDVGPTFDDVLEFDFNDPAKFDIAGLTASPTADLRFALQEAPIFVPACTEGRGTCLSHGPNSPINGYVWARPTWEAETVIAAGGLYTYETRDNYRRRYPALIIGNATVTVGDGADPAGWATFSTTFNLGNPPPDQYLWELINEVGQVALHNFGGTTLAEGDANAAFTLSDVPVGLTADQIRAAVRPELQAQRQKLSDQLLGDYESNNGPVDFYYDLGADGAPYAFFVAASDPLPTDSYDYTNPGFFADPGLVTKSSTTDAGTSGDSVHEKLALPEGETTVYVLDPGGIVHRLRFVVGDDTSEIQVYVSRRAG